MSLCILSLVCFAAVITATVLFQVKYEEKVERVVYDSSAGM